MLAYLVFVDTQLPNSMLVGKRLWLEQSFMCFACDDVGARNVNIFIGVVEV